MRFYEEGVDKAALIYDRRQQALSAIEPVKARWQWIYDNLDLPLP